MIDVKAMSTSQLVESLTKLAEARDWIAALVEDSERLTWLGELEGVNLVSDDAGRWAVSGNGFQPVPEPEGFKDTVSITSFVDADEWRPSIREAIDAARERMHEEGNG